MTRQKYFTTGQIAQHCGVNSRTVIRWINRGFIKANKIKNRLDEQISLEDFISFLNENDFTTLQKDPKAKGPKVLIIDDDLNVAKSIGRVFSTNNFNVLNATNGFKAGFLLNMERPQIITLDLNMNELNGFEILKIINGIKQNYKVLVIVISGENEDLLMKSIENGADLYLKKPFLKEDLEKIINKFYPITTGGTS